jgi:hypothetical protein
VVAYLRFRVASQAPIGEQHVVVELFRLAQLLDAWNFLGEHGVLSRLAEEVRLGEIAVVAVGVLGLDNGRTDPWRGLARMEFRSAHELGVPATIRSFGESLYGHAKQALAQEYD